VSRCSTRFSVCWAYSISFVVVWDSLRAGFQLFGELPEPFHGRVVIRRQERKYLLLAMRGADFLLDRSQLH
jgi:hypothetical protein